MFLFVSNPWAHTVLYYRRALLNRDYSFLMYRIEFDSICCKHVNLAPIGKQVLRIVNVFPIGIIHRSAVTAMQLPSTP